MPYFYIIHHIPSQRKYAGIRISKNSKKDELLKEDGYKTSSTTIHRMIERDGLDAFEILSIAEMDDPYTYETNFLKENDCANSPEWLNFHNNDGMAPFGSERFKNIMMEKYGAHNSMGTPELRKKCSDSIKLWAKNNPDKVKEQAEKIKLWAKNNPDKTKLRSEKVAANRIKNGTTGKGISKKYTNNGKTGKWIRDEEYCHKLSERQKTDSHFTKNNPMNDPEKRKLVALSKLGAKKYYREDGSSYMARPEDVDNG